MPHHFIKNADGTLTQYPSPAKGTDRKSLSNDTFGVKLHDDQPCSYVDVTAENGIISVGNDDTTRVDSGNAKGVVLTPGSTAHRVFCTNLNQVYVSGATGSGASYVYY